MSICCQCVLALYLHAPKCNVDICPTNKSENRGSGRKFSLYLPLLYICLFYSFWLPALIIKCFTFYYESIIIAIRRSVIIQLFYFSKNEWIPMTLTIFLYFYIWSTQALSTALQVTAAGLSASGSGTLYLSVGGMLLWVLFWHALLKIRFMGIWWIKLYAN